MDDTRPARSERSAADARVPSVSEAEIEEMVVDCLGAADPRAELERRAAGRADVFAAACKVLEQAERLQELRPGKRLAETRHDADPTRSGAPPPAPDQRPSEAAVTRIGPYRILERVGKGGMGEVFKAEQREPVRRIVALKVVQQGMATKEVLARFALERRALAAMSHRAIAKVFDAGATDSGEPYFVMEFIEGLPVTTYCDRHKLSVEQRLRLFQQICAGVQHAHQKGIVHRDLKPGNVLVVREGDEHVPKILDFGLAKATNREFLDATVFTEQDRVMGTYEYMAPEQAAGDGEVIDARADVYALGVMLYQLLAGELPFTTAELRQAGLHGALQLIRDSEPPKPSTKLISLRDKSSEIASRRQTSFESLSRLLRGDLDWVVMKAMAKEPERRYDAATALADDLGRYLRHEPVIAGPPSASYRLRKFARRYRVQVIAAGLVLIAITAGLAGTTWFWLDAKAQAKAADLARAGEATKAKEAAENATTAQRNAEEAMARKREFDQLAADVLYRRAVANESKLYPPWPQRIEAMERWLRDDAGKLLAMRPEIEKTVAELRARALPATQDEVEHDRTSHPKFGEWQKHAARLASLQRAQAIRSKAQELTLPLPTAPEQAMTPSQLNAWAWPRVDSDAGKRIWGEEAKALVLARLAWEKAAGLPAKERASFGNTLAWAWFVNGKDDDAKAQSEASLALVGEDEKQAYAGHLASLQTKVQAAAGEAGAKALDDLRASVAVLEAEVSARRTYRFAEEAQSFLHDTLTDLLGKLASLDAKERKAVDERLGWARRIAALTQGHPKAPVTWQAVREAIAKADGIVASELYRGQTIELREQDVMGLVPIGMNPATKLWEFYELRSAWDGQSDPAAIQIPRHVAKGDDAGYIEVGDGTGIVFVLLPGGKFTMGSQGQDPSAPNYDPQHRVDEALHEVTLAPFFLARHELTQGQWRRLSVGETPSQYKAGSKNFAGGQITWSNPVESVDWTMCDTLLVRHGMALPTEAQREYGCRAGTTTPWTCDPARLRTFANLADATAKGAGMWWTCEEWSDGHVLHAPVGSFLANAFGLFDVHGNVWEWTRDGVHSPRARPRSGDGLRGDPGSASYRVLRGGGYDQNSRSARSSLRYQSTPATRTIDLGARPARASRLDD